MDVKNLSPDLAVMPQFSETDVAELAQRGFKSIIGNRPDGVVPGDEGLLRPWEARVHRRTRGADTQG